MRFCYPFVTRFAYLKRGCKESFSYLCEKKVMKKVKLSKTKEPVRIRFKALKNGNYSIYLDTYYHKQRFYEFLKLYLVPETDAAAKEKNRLTLQEANLIKARRTLELASGRYGHSKRRQEKVRLEDYLAEYRQRNAMTRRGSSFDSMTSNMQNYLTAFLGRKMRTLLVSDIDTELCKRFANYLKRACTSTGRPLSAVSAYHYFTAFRGLLQEAVNDGLLAENPAARLRKQETPRRPDVTKIYLDTDEVVMLATTDCRMDTVKRAFMFSCMTGLRLSDIRQLRWSDIRHEGDGWRFSIIMKKTQEPMQSKLSNEAFFWLPVPGQPDEQVFPLPCNSTLANVLREWTEAAAVGKHVTFHTARHSYATMALSAGNDLYTISKLLGHRNIKTTTVYAAVVDTQRDAAVDSVSRLFRKRLRGHRMKAEEK